MPRQDEGYGAGISVRQPMPAENHAEFESVQSAGWSVGLGLFFSALLWPFAVLYVRQPLRDHYQFDLFTLTFILGPAACLLIPAAVLLYKRRWLGAITALALLPAIVFGNYILMISLDSLLELLSLRRNLVPGQVLIVIECAIPAATGLILALRYCRRIMRSGPRAPATRWRKAASLAVMFAVVSAASMKFLLYNMDQEERGRVRARISELILAGSSAKTALSEGMQTYGTWSASWMSAITISATGMISSASIGPAGEITVYGTALTSGSVVTMIPTTTTDNKLVWSCTGHPARYMPASCR